MQTLTTHNEQGHLLISIGSKRAIIDTGSPASMAPEPFDILGGHHSPPTNIMGVTPGKMSELSGIQIDMLIGCDILSKHTLRLRCRDNAIDAGDEITDGPISSRLTTLMGIPIFPLILGGRSTKAIFDTGAHLSYIDPALVEGQTVSGQRTDFYPFVGQFSALTYIVPTALDHAPIDIEYGILPDSLQVMLGMVMTMSESSAVVGTQLLEFFDCTISWKKKTISWRKR